MIKKKEKVLLNGKIRYKYLMRCVVCGEQFEIFRCIFDRGEGYVCSIKCRSIRDGILKKGYKHTKKTREKMKLSHSKRTLWNKGKKMSEAHCKKLSEAHKGLIPWMKGKKHTEETKEKIRIAVKNNPTRYWLGKKRSKETIDKIRKAHTGIKLPRQLGKNNPNWKGGVSKLSDKIKKSLEYKYWREKVFKRDNYTCQKCKKKGGIIHPHHIKSFALILKENNITTLEQALKCKELWNTDNGQTLCKDCHKLTNSYGKNI
ncbi:MAG: hypothetical protein KAT66_00790 [Candidatus Lokiarchaeota archaeon]|nr:hypothetical protein [Candidatus Lokiarchaeota archaeon]